MFPEKVESGEKPITIRAEGKRVFRLGDPLFLFTGLRTLACRKLSTPYRPQVHGVYPVWIDRSGRLFARNRGRLYLLPDECRAMIAALDGFDTVEAWVDYFTRSGKSAFKGQIIQMCFFTEIDHVWTDLVEKENTDWWFIEQMDWLDEGGGKE
jgi:hypothetical protein